ncbi:MAG: DUF6427 family protein [Bacteroidales bacterium]|nr:DUF6427 family protein [Bacteroidales bacterium]
MILLRIFKNNRLTGTVAIFLLLIAIFVPSFVDLFRTGVSRELIPLSGMPFYKLVFGSIHKVPVLSHLVAMLLLLMISFTLIRIGIRYPLLQQRSLMPAFFFILFAASLPAARQVSPALVGSLFYLIFYSVLFEVQEEKADTLSIFAASLILVLGSMFYLKLIWFLPLIWISLWTLRPVTWRELFYPVVAYALLILILFTWFWGIRDQGAGFVDLLRKNFTLSGSFQAWHYSVYLLYGFFLMLVAIASIFMAYRFQTMKTVAQNIYQVLFYMFLGGILFFLFIGRFDPSALVFIAFPVAFVLSNFFHRKKNSWIHELVLWILLGLVVYVQWMV